MHTNLERGKMIKILKKLTGYSQEELEAMSDKDLKKEISQILTRFQQNLKTIKAFLND